MIHQPMTRPWTQTWARTWTSTRIKITDADMDILRHGHGCGLGYTCLPFIHMRASTTDSTHLPYTTTPTDSHVLNDASLCARTPHAAPLHLNDAPQPSPVPMAEFYARDARAATVAPFASMMSCGDPRTGLPATCTKYNLIITTFSVSIENIVSEPSWPS